MKVSARFEASGATIHQFLRTNKLILRYYSGAVSSMDYIEKVLEKLKELARKLIEALLGPEAEAEPELIPIPVNEPRRR
jgi:hypothetical protein